MIVTGYLQMAQTQGSIHLLCSLQQKRRLPDRKLHSHARFACERESPS